MENVLIAVFDRTDVTEPLAYLPEVMELMGLEELNRPGGFSFKVRIDDPTVTDRPDLLDAGRLVQIKVNGREFWFEIERPAMQTIVETENGDRCYEVAGPGVLSWLSRAVVYPPSGTMKTGARYFGFASPPGPWLVPEEWTEPVSQGMAGTNELYGQPYPNDWPIPNTEWVWDRNTKTSPAPAGDIYLRREFSTSGKKAYRIYASADSIAAIAIDGEQVMAVTEFGAWRKTFYKDIEIDAGQHVLAVHARKRDEGTAGVALALVEFPDGTDPKGATKVVWTGQPGWEMQAYPPVPPGWSPGLIMKTLVDEAAARGTLHPYPTLGFDGDVDSYGDPWPDKGDWGWKLGVDYQEVMETLTGTMVETWVEGLEVQMAPRRGTDLSDRVGFFKGLNVQKAASKASDVPIVNTVLLRTSGGLKEVTAEVPESLTRFGRRESYIGASNSSAEVGNYLAKQVFQEQTLPVQYPTLNVVPIDGSMPFIDFQVGDWVLAPATEDGDTTVRRRVVSIGFQQAEKSGLMSYSVEVDSIEMTEAERMQRALDRREHSLLSGAIALEGGDGGAESGDGGQVPPETESRRPGKVQGLTGQAAAVLTGDGRVLAEVALEWLEVTTDPFGVGIGIDGYQVWHRLNEAGQNWRMISETEALAFTAGGYQPETAWQFRVRAIADNRMPGEWSDVVTFLMPADDVPPPTPSRPMLNSRLGVLIVNWDGYSVSAETMPPDLSYLRVLVSGGPNTAEWRIVADEREAVGYVWDAGPGAGGRFEIGETVTVTFVAVDRSGNESDESQPQSTEIQGIEMPDIDDVVRDAIDEARDQANFAVEAANRKNTNYYGPDEPTAPAGGFRVGDTWFQQTPDGVIIHHWNGTEWESERVSPEGISETIQDAIDEAGNKADFAVAAVNGKNTNYYGPNQPTAPAGGFRPGDTWFETQTGQTAVAQNLFYDPALSAVTDVGAPPGDLYSPDHPVLQHALFEDSEATVDDGVLTLSRPSGGQVAGVLVGQAPIGEPVGAQVEIRALGGARSGLVNLVVARPSNGDVMQQLRGKNIASLTGEWQTITLEPTVTDDDPGEPSCLIMIFTTPGTPGQAGGIQIRRPIATTTPEAGDPYPVDLPFFDGDTVLPDERFGEWDGTPHHSTSTLYKPAADAATIHTWDGTEWVPQRLGPDGISEIIQDAIDQAVQDADTAVQAANGKNTIYQGPNAPTAPAGGFRIGDTWFDTSGSTTVIKTWSGTAWVSQEIQAELGPGSITSTHIADDAITTPKIAAGAVTANEIAANAITAGKIAAGSIVAGDGVIASLDAGVISTGTLDADRIDSRSISADKLLIASGGNALPNPHLEGSPPPGWPNWGKNRSNGPNGQPSIWLRGSVTRVSEYFPVEPGRYYAFRALARGQFANTNVYVQLQTNGTVADGQHAHTTTGTTNPYMVSNKVLGTGWTLLEGVIRTPSDATEARLQVYGNHSNSTGDTSGYQWFTDWNFHSQVSGTLIEDGAITTNKIAANAVTANEIATGTITAGSGIIASLDAGVISTGTLDADRIGANTITAEKLLVGRPRDLAPGPGGYEALYEDGAGDPAQIFSTSNDPSGAYISIPVAPALVVERSVYGPLVPVRQGERITWESYATYGGTNPSTNWSTYVYWYDANGVALASPDHRTAITTESQSGGTNGWSRGQVEVPEGAEHARARFYTTRDANATGSRGFRNFDIRVQTSGTLIEDGAITTEKIKVGAITAASGIIGSIDAGVISTGILSADRIGAQTIMSDKLIVSRGGNIVADPRFEADELNAARIASATGGTSWTVEPAGVFPARLYATYTGTSNWTMFLHNGARNRETATSVKPGETWLFEADVQRGAGEVRWTADLYRADGSSSYSAIGAWSSSFFEPMSLTAEWTVPADVVAISPAIQWTAASKTGGIYAGSVRVARKVSGTLIEDGAITTDKIAANAITAGKISAGSIETNHIDAGAITAAKIAGNAITADKIEANAITSKHTITGALIRTSATASRVQMTGTELTVIRGGTTVVRLAGSVDTGLEVLDPYANILVPLGRAAFNSHSLTMPYTGPPDYNHQVGNGILHTYGEQIPVTGKFVLVHLSWTIHTTAGGMYSRVQLVNAANVSQIIAQSELQLLSGDSVRTVSGIRVNQPQIYVIPVAASHRGKNALVRLRAYGVSTNAEMEWHGVRAIVQFF